MTLNPSIYKHIREYQRARLQLDSRHWPMWEAACKSGELAILEKVTLEWGKEIDALDKKFRKVKR